MGWFDTKNKHQQVIVHANAWDMQRIEERNRKRNWFIFLDIILIICVIIGIYYLYANKDYKTGLIFLIIGGIIILYLTLRKGKKEPKNNQSFRRRGHFKMHKNFNRKRRFRRRHY